MNGILNFINISWVSLLGASIALLIGVATNTFAELIIPKLRKRFALEEKKGKKTYREMIKE